jgi:integrase
MRHADIDLDRAEWRVPAEHSKSGETYTVPLLPAAVATLARRRTTSTSPRVFAFAEATLDRAWPRTLTRMQRLRLLDALHLPATAPGTLAQLTAEAVRRRIPPTDYEIAHCTIHDLRRTVGSHAAMAGVSLHIIGKLLGRTSSRATGVYARLSQDALRDAATRASMTLSPQRTRADVVSIGRAPDLRGARRP